MRLKTITSEQMEALFLLLGYQLRPVKGPCRIFENKEFDALQLLPEAGKEPNARIEHLMTLRKISIEKGIVDEDTFEELLEQVRRQPSETNGVGEGGSNYTDQNV